MLENNTYRRNTESWGTGSLTSSDEREAVQEASRNATRRAAAPDVWGALQDADRNKPQRMTASNTRVTAGSRNDAQGLHEKAARAVTQVNHIILGKEAEVREAMLVFLAGGHILLEDIPGVGKTTMALAFSRTLKLDYNRVQFTPDLMPSDLTGFSIYSREAERFIYQQGSVFCNLLLADEINRTSPKTQSALLEVMEERQVTIDGETRAVPSPFFVIATQNPSGSIGTQPLPEAQVDRFMVHLSMGYPDFESELMIARGTGVRERIEGCSAVMTSEEVLKAQRSVREIYVRDDLYRYILELITATRNHGMIARGASPRATIALTEMAKAAAWLNGRNFVLPDDISDQFAYVVAHRLTLGTSARFEKVNKEQVIQDILKNVRKPAAWTNNAY